MNEQTGGRQRVHIWLQGRVQGVGFRAYVKHIAARLGLTGWVRNVGRDRVETVADGERPVLEQFIEAVQKGPPSSRVEAARLEWEPVAVEFPDFEVRASD